MGRLTRLLRRALPLAGLGVVVGLPVALGITRRERTRARAEAAKVLKDALERRPTPPALEALATHELLRLGNVPEAYAYRALARAWHGDLPGARDDLDAAEEGDPVAQRARAWIQFRAGESWDLEGDDSPRVSPGLFIPSDWDERRFDLPGYWGSNPLDGPDWWAGSTLTASSSFTGRADRSFRYVEGETNDESATWASKTADAEWAGECVSAAALRELAPRVARSLPGTVEASVAEVALARLDWLWLDDDAAHARLARAQDAPPHERACAREALAEIDAGEREGVEVAGERLYRGREEPWEWILRPRPSRWEEVQPTLVHEAVDAAERELEAFLLLRDPRDLALATRRLRRALALLPGDDRAQKLLALAWAQQPGQHAKALAALAETLVRKGHLRDATRAFWALGDEATARRVYEREGETWGTALGTQLRGVLGEDRSTLRFEAGVERAVAPGEGDRALRVSSALALRCEAAVLSDLERLFAGERPPRELLRARVPSDPLGVLAALAVAWPLDEDPALRRAAARLLEGERRAGTVAARLAARGLVPDLALRAAALAELP